MTLPTTSAGKTVEYVDNPLKARVERKGDFTSMCATGTQFWPLDPRREEIHLTDIARGLSMQCRWGGHVNRYFSVAQHCLLVSWHSPNHPLAGLLHDAAEAYLVDVPTPIKAHLRGYHAIEETLLLAIGEKFRVPLVPLPDEVKEADARMLATENRDLRERLPYWSPSAEPYLDVIQPMSPEKAEQAFLGRAWSLGLR